MCGHGNKKRNVACRREDGVDVSRHLCDDSNGTFPEMLTECEIPCPLDCEVSEWGEWGECSSICGNGKILF